MKVAGWVVLAIVVIGGLWWLLSHRSASVSGTGAIKIGFIAPLTGDAAAYGEPVINGTKLAVDEINKAGGINGRQIQLIVEDGKCTGQDAASAAQKLVNVDQVKYIIGAVCSGETATVLPITDPAKVLVISPGSSAAKLTQSGYKYFFRNNPNDNIPGMTLADYLAKNYKNAAVISEKTDYAQGIKSVFVSQAQKDGLTVGSQEDYDTNTTDFRSILTKVKATNPDVMFINSQTSANMLRIAQQARQVGIQAVFAGAVFNDPDTISKPIVNGAVLAVPPGLATAGKGADFATHYKATYGKEPAYAFYAGAAYDDVYLLAQGITAAGDDATKVRDYLHSMKPYTGTIGTYAFDQNGDFTGISSILQKIVNGTLVTIQ